MKGQVLLKTTKQNMQYNQSYFFVTYYQNSIVRRLIDKNKLVKNHKNLLILSLMFMTFLYSCSPRLANGIYTGTEKITVAPDNTLWPGIIAGWTDFKDTLNRQWFHQVTITIKGENAIITKEPFYMKDGTEYFSEAAGGFYFYKGDIQYDKTDKTFNISCSLNSCKYCPRTATATPLYTYESYEIRRKKRNLTINTDYQKGLIFKRR